MIASTDIMRERLQSARLPLRANGRRVITALGSLFVLATSGCGQILGVDEYRIGEPPVENPCGPLQAWAGGSACVNVGVVQCGAGFQSDDKGGCDPKLGATVCLPGQVVLATRWRGVGEDAEWRRASALEWASDAGRARFSVASLR